MELSSRQASVYSTKSLPSRKSSSVSSKVTEAPSALLQSNSTLDVFVRLLALWKRLKLSLADAFKKYVPEGSMLMTWRAAAGMLRKEMAGAVSEAEIEHFCTVLRCMEPLGVTESLFSHFLLHAAAAHEAVRARSDPTQVMSRLQEYLTENEMLLRELFPQLSHRDIQHMVPQIPGLSRGEQCFALACLHQTRAGTEHALSFDQFWDLIARLAARMKHSGEPSLDDFDHEAAIFDLYNPHHRNMPEHWPAPPASLFLGDSPSSLTYQYSALPASPGLHDFLLPTDPSLSPARFNKVDREWFVLPSPPHELPWHYTPKPLMPVGTVQLAPEVYHTVVVYRSMNQAAAPAAAAPAALKRSVDRTTDTMDLPAVQPPSQVAVPPTPQYHSSTQYIMQPPSPVAPAPAMQYTMFHQPQPTYVQQPVYSYGPSQQLATPRAAPSGHIFTRFLASLKAKGLTPSQVFRMYDANGNGNLSRAEVLDMLRKEMVAGISVTDQRHFESVMDTDGVQGVTEREFESRLVANAEIEEKAKQGQDEERVLERLASYLTQNEQLLRSVFKEYDLDGNGSLDHTELHALVSSIPNLQSHQQKLIMARMAQADTSGDGKLSFDEFLAEARSLKGAAAPAVAKHVAGG